MKHEYPLQYDKRTAEYMDRWEEIIFKAPYVWDEAKIMAALRKFYKALDRKFPKEYQVRKCRDIFDEGFREAACSACSAYFASLTHSAPSASSASSAFSASSAYSASSVSSAYSAYWAHLAIFSFEYYLYKNPIDENGRKLLLSQEAIMEAYENGLGHFAEKEGVFYLVPAPIVRLNEKNQKHSETQPAIEWKEGKKFYYLNDVEFPKDLWERITKRTITAKEAFQLENTEQRIIAIQYLGGDKLEKELGAVVLDKHKYNYGTDYLIELKGMKDNLKQPYKYIKGYDPAEKGYVYIRTHPKCKTLREAHNFCYRLELFGLDYQPDNRS